MAEDNIRNFVIIAHIDHGKSTLADRMLEITDTVEERQMKDQMLDQMELERERGITIKLQPVRMRYRGYVLNLIDTPGHVDFQYEVSRSLQAVEGAVLLVDATQGIQAQTLANLYLAMEQDLTVVPVVNKIDLPAADVAGVKREMQGLIGIKEEEILTISAKTGEGVEQVLRAIIDRVPPARIERREAGEKMRALIFDSVYDEYKGVVAYVRVMEGSVRATDMVRFMATDAYDKAIEVGTFGPEFQKARQLSAGEIGYIATGLKEVVEARVGDTVTVGGKEEGAQPLPGFKTPQPKVFAGVYPASGDQFPELREAIEKLRLNDASLEAKQERSVALGQGYRCGFLGMLHLEIVQERLKREFGIDLVITTPSVMYKVQLGSGAVLDVHTPAQWPDPSLIEKVMEQYVEAEVIAADKYLGGVFKLMKLHEGKLLHQEYLGSKRVMLKYELPLRSLVVDLYDQLKSATAGYGSIGYELKGWQEAAVEKLSVLINYELVEAMALVVPKSKIEEQGRKVVEALKKVIPKQLFAVPIQAAVGGRVVARETVSALRKDVTGHLYGGDVTRKRKLLEKQKKGKKKMALGGSVDIPSEAYLAVLKR